MFRSELPDECDRESVKSGGRMLLVATDERTGNLINERLEKGIKQQSKVLFLFLLTLTCLPGSFLTNPVAAAIFPAPSTVFWATLVTPETTTSLIWDMLDTVLPATGRRRRKPVSIWGKHTRMHD